MATEIERKFLVAGDAWRAQALRAIRMRQGYLCPEGDSRASVRVRVSAGAAGPAAHLNIKAAVIGSARAEYEYPLPLADAEQMLDTLCIGLVEKTRHLVPSAAHLWEVDEFFGANAGLVVAEIELGAVDEAFARPAWLGREVTDEVRYYNHALSTRPYCSWPEPLR
jgi:adenylate cyclase